MNDGPVDTILWALMQLVYIYFVGLAVGGILFLVGRALYRKVFPTPNPPKLRGRFSDWRHAPTGDNVSAVVTILLCLAIGWVMVVPVWGWVLDATGLRQANVRVVIPPDPNHDPETYLQLPPYPETLGGPAGAASNETEKCQAARKMGEILDNYERDFFLHPVLIDASLAAEVPDLAKFKGELLDGMPSETFDGSDPDDFFWTGDAAVVRDYLRTHC